MRTLVFDGRTGAAGDMICAALLAAGADPAVLSPVENHLPVRYEAGVTVKNGIRATTLDVVVADDGADGPTGDADGRQPDGNAHGHADGDHPDGGHAHGERRHHHDHTASREPSGERPHAEGAGVERTYPEVVSIVESMGLDDSVEAAALDVFELLGRAEASVHGTELGDTHFHEVGADDAIADVVGAVLLVDDLGVDRVVTTPVAVGGGTVEMSHGVYPVPTPAVVEIAARSGLATVGGPVDRELLTPTGAAILGTVAESVDAAPQLNATAVGYGAGDATLDRHPNVLRALVGDGGERDDAAEADRADETDGSHGLPDAAAHGPTRGTLTYDDVAVLETNLDDATPELLGGLQESLKRAGARDVSIVPVTMKKSRPGHLVKVVCKPSDADAVAERLARETGTLGVRQTGATHRWIADRRFETATLDIDGDGYEIAVKVASTSGGDVYDVSAEYDDAAEVASLTDLPVREVMRRAEAAIRPDR